MEEVAFLQTRTHKRTGLQRKNRQELLILCELERKKCKDLFELWEIEKKKSERLLLLINRERGEREQLCRELSALKRDTGNGECPMEWV